MVIEREIWTKPFSKSEFPPWVCPTCSHGILTLKDTSFIKGETADSISNKSHPAWDPEWKSDNFACRMICTYNSCKESVMVCGWSSPRINRDLIEGEYMVDILHPIFVYPAPNIFSIPSKCPEKISNEIRKAFALYWCDTNAAGNRVRACIELLMDHLKIKKRMLTKKRKYRSISLHDRILDYHPQNPEMGEQLLAIKWIGNTGSHSSGLTKDDLIDDFEMLQFVLDDIFELQRKRLKAMAKGINKKKGPARKK